MIRALLIGLAFGWMIAAALADEAEYTLKLKAGEVVMVGKALGDQYSYNAVANLLDSITKQINEQNETRAKSSPLPAEAPK